MSDVEPPREDPSEPAPVPSIDEVADDLAADLTAAQARGTEEERRYPSTIGGAFYLVVLGVTAAGIAVAWSGDWRLGVRLLAGALMAGAAVRLVLPARDAGMLAVRHRVIDCVLLGGVGGLLFFLATTIPDQPGP